MLREVAERLRPLVPAEIDTLACLELGGCALREDRSALRRRRRGRQRLLVVEDVLTSGGQVAESVQTLCAEGTEVAHVLTVIDRESGGTQHLRREGLTLHRLFRRPDFSSTMSTDTPAPFARG